MSAIKDDQSAKNTNESGDAPKQPEAKDGQADNNQMDKKNEPNENQESKAAASSGGHDTVGYEKYVTSGGSGGSRQETQHGYEALANH